MLGGGMRRQIVSTTTDVNDSAEVHDEAELSRSLMTKRDGNMEEGVNPREIQVSGLCISHWARGDRRASPGSRRAKR